MTERIVPDGQGACAILSTASRRGVLSGAVAASGLALAPAVPAWATTAPAPAPLRAVFDRSLPQGLGFAERLRVRGISATSFAGDVSGLWFDVLLPALRKERGPLTGLTGAGALFCVEQLAWDVGMRVRLRVDHVKAGGGFEHVAGGALPPAVLSRLRAADAAFGETAADLALECRAAWGNCTHAPAAGANALVTWVIAPLDAARV